MRRTASMPVVRSRRAPRRASTRSRTPARRSPSRCVTVRAPRRDTTSVTGWSRRPDTAPARIPAMIPPRTRPAASPARVSVAMAATAGRATTVRRAGVRAGRRQRERPVRGIHRPRVARRPPVIRQPRTTRPPRVPRRPRATRRPRVLRMALRAVAVRPVAALRTAADRAAAIPTPEPVSRRTPLPATRVHRPAPMEQAIPPPMVVMPRATAVSPDLPLRTPRLRTG